MPTEKRGPDALGMAYNNFLDAKDKFHDELKKWVKTTLEELREAYRGEPIKFGRADFKNNTITIHNIFIHGQKRTIELQSTGGFYVLSGPEPSATRIKSMTVDELNSIELIDFIKQLRVFKYLNLEANPSIKLRTQLKKEDVKP